MSIFSLITARKNSKGLKDKVVLKINNKYVFEYSLDYSTTLQSKVNTDVFTVISSDSEIIEKFCLEKGIAFVKRDPRIATDIAQIEDVIYDAYKRIGKGFKYISLLYGNIPTRYPEEFLKAFKFLETNDDYDAVLSMQNVEKHNPAWMYELNEHALPVKKEEGFRRQDLKQFMIHDGHTVLVRSNWFIKFMETKKRGKRIMHRAFGRRIKPMLNDKLIVDIDTEKDLRLAEAVLRCRS